MNKNAALYCCLAVILLIVYDTSGFVYLDELYGKPCTLDNDASGVYKRTQECSLRNTDAGGTTEAKVVCCPLSEDDNTGKNDNTGNNNNTGKNDITGNNNNTGKNDNIGQNDNTGKNDNIGQNDNIGKNGNTGENDNTGKSAAFTACEKYNFEKLVLQIFDGIEDADNKFPYMAALGYDNTEGAIDDNPIIYKCAGILISFRYVLTAAHCVSRANKETPFMVRLGSTDLNSADKLVQEIFVKDIIVHPNYNRNVNYNDIALLRLEKSAKLSKNVSPICLQSKPLANITIDDNTLFTTVGFRKLRAGHKSTKQLMKTTNTSVVLTNICAMAYAKHAKFPSGIDENSFCALDSNWNDCRSQISGPLLLNTPNQPASVIGIPSFEQTCNGIMPEVYISVYSYLDWIESHVWEGSQCEMKNGAAGIYKKLRECPARITDAGKKTTGAEIVCCPLSALKRTGVRADAACHKYETKGTSPIDEAGLKQKGISDSAIEFPHMAALGYEDTDGTKENPIVYRCSGVLISSRYVLTTAHCVRNKAYNVPVRVRFGSMDLKSTGGNVQEILVSNITVHPKYKLGDKYNDIALLRLKKPTRLSDTVKPICLQTKPLPNLDTNNGISFITIGFKGMEDFDTADMKLMKTPNISLVPRNICAEKYQEISSLSSGLDDNMICVLDNNWKTRKDFCQIELVGPLLMISKTTKTVIGIPSFGRGCDGPIPGVYVSVYSYLDWIESHVWPEK